MKRTWMSVPLALAMAGAVVLAGQTPGAQTPTGRMNDQSQTAKAITVTGCLQAANPAGTTTSAPQDPFVLTNATMGAASTTTTAGAKPAGSEPPDIGATTPRSTSPPTAAANSSTSGSSYALDGRSDELAKHRGHRIEVTGTLMAASAKSSGMTGTTGTAPPDIGATTPNPQSPTATNTGVSTQAPMGAQRLQVTSIRMISATCP